MPGVERLGWRHGLIDAVKEARSFGVNQVVLFPKVQQLLDCKAWLQLCIVVVIELYRTLKLHDPGHMTLYGPSIMPNVCMHRSVHHFPWLLLSSFCLPFHPVRNCQPSAYALWLLRQLSQHIT